MAVQSAAPKETSEKALQHVYCSLLFLGSGTASTKARDRRHQFIDKSTKKPPVLANKRLLWYARCDSNARPLESEGFVVTAFPLITALEVQIMTLFPRYITCFSEEASRKKQAVDAKPSPLPHLYNA